MILLALSPILLLLALIFIFRQALYKIIPFVFIYASLVVFFIWKIDNAYYFLSLIKGFLIAFDILIIVFGAIFFIEFLKENSALDYIKSRIFYISEDIRVQLVLIVWLFGSFIEGLTGFGVPATITAPLLLMLGIKPVLAVAIALIGNSTAVAFGAVGTPIRVGFNLLDNEMIKQIVFNTGLINLIAGTFVPLILISVFVMSRKNWKFIEIKEMIAWSIFAGLSFTLPYFLFSLISYEFPSILGGLFGLFIVIYSLKRGFLLPKKLIKNELKTNFKKLKMSRFKALSPYFFLIIFLFLGKMTLSSININLLNISNYSLNLFNPGLAFLLSIIAFSFLYKSTFKIIKKAFNKSSHALKSPFIAIFFTVSLVQLMIQSAFNSSGLKGMIEIVSGIISPTIHLYISPVIGAFGSFIAGSATVSNLLFTDLHILINQGNEVSLSLILALQLTGASVGNIIALTNIVSAQSIVGIKGREVAIITKSFPAFFIYLSLIILIAYLINIIT